MLAVDAFAESDEDVTAAVAFAAQVLQVPLEVVKQSVTAGDISVVRKMSADQEPDASQSPKVKNTSAQVLDGSHQHIVHSSQQCTCCLHNCKICAHMNLTSTSEKCGSKVL